MRYLIGQYITLSLFVLFMGYCFCDGFKLHVTRKLLWFVIFLAICAWVFKVAGEFDLAAILPFPLALAAVLCVFQQAENRKKAA